MNNQPNTNASNENVRLFRTITDATEPIALTYLARTNTITEALNTFYMMSEQSRQAPSPSVIRTTSSTANQARNQPAVIPGATMVRSQSMAPGAQVVRTVSTASSTGAASVSSSAQAVRPQVIRIPSPVRKKKVNKKKKNPSPAKEEPPQEESPPTSPETSPERQGKRNYSEMISKYVKEEMSDEKKKKQWPKYLGSIKVQCQCLDHIRKKIKVGDVLTFSPNDIEFKLAVTRKGEKVYSIKGNSLHVGTFWERNLVGYLRCEFEEIFVFLLTMGYIIMDGTVLTKPSKKHLMKGNSQKRFSMRVDIFLTEEAVKDPLNVMTQPGRRSKDFQKFGGKEKSEEEKELLKIAKAKAEANNKGKGKGKGKTQEEEMSEEEQKMHHICRLTKESFVKLFGILQIKVTIPTVVRLKHRADPFNSVRREKYGGHQDWYDRRNYKINCYEDKAELLTDQYPNYYRRKNNPEPPQLIDLSSPVAVAGARSEGSLSNPQRLVRADSDEMQIEMKKEESKTIEEDLDEIEKRILKKYGTDNFEVPASKNLNQRSQSTQNNNNVKKRRHTISAVRSGRRDWSDDDDDDDDEDNEIYESSEDENLEEEDREPFGRSSSVQAPKPRGGEFFNPFGGISQSQGNQDNNENSNEGGQVKSHLNELFNLQNQNSNHFSLSEPPKTFKSELHVYQKQALTWMKYREGCLENQRLYDKLNEEIRLLNDLFEELVLIDGSKIYFNPFNGEITVNFPKSKPCKGGLLADEMGLGKTVMTIALIHSHKRPERNEVHEEDEREGGMKKKVRKSLTTLKIGSGDDDNGEDNKAGTLIIVPVTVLSQWENEMFTHSNDGTIKVLQYYGQSRNKSGKVNLTEYDVVVTSYGVVGSDFASQKEKKKTGLFAYNWFRVILDEAHFIKNRSSRNAKAACSLQSDYRWCLTGTPLQNKLDDLFSIIKYLRVETWGEYYLWNTYINKDTANDEAFELLRSILRPIILRRTKKSTYLDGRTILELPPKEVKTQMIQLTSEERQIYNNLFNGGKNQFDNIVSGGTLQYEYAHVFELLMKLRMVCDHPSLVFSTTDLKDGATLKDAIFKFLDKRQNSSLLNPKNKSNARSNSNLIEPEEEKEAAASSTGRKKIAGISDEFLQDTIKKLESKQIPPCTVCLDEIVDPVITNCCHVFCRPCIMGVVDNLKNCPICRKHLDLTDLMPVTLEDNKQLFTDLLDVSGDKFKKSSKLQALFDYVHIVRDKKEKIVVFSQFLGMLTLIERGLKEEGILYRRLDGSCSLAQRTRYIDEFKTEPDVTVFMVSLKAGAIGLNLTVANHCVLVDPWWNPAVEDQAIERVHRIGQKNSVTVVRLICEKTIEERMLDLHAKKKGLVDMTLHFNPEEQKKQNMENMIYIMRNYDDA